jgi:hypothetical protein
METKLLPCPSELVKRLRAFRHGDAAIDPGAMMVLIKDAASYIERTAQAQGDRLAVAMDALHASRGRRYGWTPSNLRDCVPEYQNGIRVDAEAVLAAEKQLRAAQGVMVTDEMAERVLEEYHGPRSGWLRWSDDAKRDAKEAMTRALTAALNPKPEVSK